MVEFNVVNDENAVEWYPLIQSEDGNGVWALSRCVGGR